MRFKISLTFSLFLFAFSGIAGRCLCGADANAQEPTSAATESQIVDCGTALSRAEHAYELGKFHEVLDILSPCLPDGLAEDDIWRGYRLRAIAYLMLDSPDSAEDAIRYMLRKNPDYRAIPEVDPYEFVRALAPYTDYPQFAMGVFLDGLATEVQLIQANTLTQTAATSGDYGIPIKINAGAEALYSFNPKFSTGFDIALLYEDIVRNLDPIRGESSQYTENISSVALPLFARYRLDTLHFLGTRMQPFFEAGGFGQWITPIAAKITLTDQSGVTTPLPDPNPGGSRKSFNYGWTVSAGIVIPLQGAEIIVRGRYWNGLTDLTQPSARYSNSLFLPAYYEADDIALRNFELSIGINLLFGYREYKLDDRPSGKQ